MKEIVKVSTNVTFVKKETGKHTEEVKKDGIVNIREK